MRLSVDDGFPLFLVISFFDGVHFEFEGFKQTLNFGVTFAVGLALCDFK